VVVGSINWQSAISRERKVTRALGGKPRQRRSKKGTSSQDSRGAEVVPMRPRGQGCRASERE